MKQIKGAAVTKQTPVAQSYFSSTLPVCLWPLGGSLREQSFRNIDLLHPTFHGAVTGKFCA